MFKTAQFTTSFGRVNSGFQRLPDWARFVVIVAAIPGICLMVLSILAILVSLFALLVLTLPVYSALARLTQKPVKTEEVVASPGVKRVDATVIN